MALLPRITKRKAVCKCGAKFTSNLRNSLVWTAWCPKCVAKRRWVDGGYWSFGGAR